MKIGILKMDSPGRGACTGQKKLGKSFFAGKKDVGPTERHVFRMETHFSPEKKMSVQRKGMFSAWKIIFRWKNVGPTERHVWRVPGLKIGVFGVGNPGF